MTDAVSLQISGMSCQHCVRAVESALKNVDGVELERVEVGRAELKYDPARTNIAEITDAVADAGYSAEAGLDR